MRFLIQIDSPESMKGYLGINPAQITKTNMDS